MSSLPDLPPPSKRRSLLLFGMLRAAATIAGLVAAYYLLPFDHLSDATSVLLLVVGLVGVIVIVVWEVRGILNSQYPAYKAVEALTITAPLFLLLFATATFSSSEPRLRVSPSPCRAPTPCTSRSPPFPPSATAISPPRAKGRG